MNVLWLRRPRRCICGWRMTDWKIVPLFNGWHPT